jgi:putative oxidoreductase
MFWAQEMAPFNSPLFPDCACFADAVTWGMMYVERLRFRALREQTAIERGTRTLSQIMRGTRMSTEIEPQRLIFPGLAGLYQGGAPYAYAFMRFATGAVLVPHGIQKLLYNSVDKFAPIIGGKGLPFPEVLTYVTFFTESVVAAFLAIGLFTRVAAAMIWIEMLVIITVFNWQFGYFWTNRGVEYALLWLLLCTAIFFRGGGRYSVDHLIGKEL